MKPTRKVRAACRSERNLYMNDDDYFLWNNDKFIIKELEAGDYEDLLPYFNKRYSHITENMFVTNLLWKNFYRTRFMRDDDGLIWIMDIDGEPATMGPLCGAEDIKRYFNAAEDYFNGQLGVKLNMYAVDEEAVNLIGPDPDRYEVTPDRDCYDYIYDAAKIKNYSGKAYHGKKNHVNAFKKNFEGRYEYVSFTGHSEYRDEIMSFLRRWEEERAIEDAFDRPEYEIDGVDYVISNCDRLGFNMGGIRIDGRLEAFSLGTYGRKERMAVISVEKADHSVRGLYPFIFQQFLIHEFPDALIVNREDDLGLENLRKSKLSYHPVYMVKKYAIRQK